MTRNRKLFTRGLPALGLTGVMVASMVSGASASSHREAPLISSDPQADLTDLYAFMSPDAKDTLSLVMNVNPMEQAAGGPNFYKFADDVLYQFNIDNNGDALPDWEYQFRFTTTTQNPKTFLYNTGQVTSLTDPDLNVRQTYTVTQVNVKTGTSKVVGSNLPVPPVNVGNRSTPNYEANLAKPAIKTISVKGEGSSSATAKVFAGPRDDPFFADLGQIFDLGGLGPFLPAHLIPSKAQKGEDYLAELNVHTIVLQLPKASVVRTDPVVGVWATTYRMKSRVLDGKGGLSGSGGWVQVSRLGQPLVNEVVIPMGMKDKFNNSQPKDDLQFAGNVLNPELGNLIEVLYPGVKVPHDVDLGLGLGGREDIATIFLTGIPGVNKPASVKPSEELRINTGIASGFPNGRTLTDDIVDTELRALAGATPFTPEFNKSPNKDLGDGVNASDHPVSNNFPYLASPNFPDTQS